MKNKKLHFFMTTVRIVIIALFIFCIFCIFLISPYKEWDNSLKIVDYDVADAEKVVLLLVSTANIPILLLSRKSHKAFVVIHILLAAICFMQFLWLLTL